MAQANLGAVVTDAWDMAQELARYGHKPLTVGWYQGRAYVRLWDFRSGAMGRRRLPSHDAREPKQKPPAWDLFRSSALFRALR